MDGDTDLGNSTFQPLTAGENGESVCMLLRGVGSGDRGRGVRGWASVAGTHGL